MSTPGAVDPTVPSETAVPTPVPSTSPTSDEIRDLATQLTQPQIPFDPAEIRKGIITTVNATTTPPNVSLTMSGDATVIDGVVALDSYSPVVGDTVLVIKQGTNIFVLGQINDSGAGSANGWQTAGGVSYRVVIDNGDQKVQLKGSYAVSGTALFTLALGFRPTVTRTLVAGRDGASTSILVQIATSGAVTLVNGTTTIGTDTLAAGVSGSTGPFGGTDVPSTGSTAGSGTFDVFGSSGLTHLTDNDTSGTTTSPAHVHHTEGTGNPGHTHGAGSYGAQSHSHTMSHTHNLTVNGHTHSTPAHAHTQTLALPANVYFDSLEFFI
jgi:hypothetical protein